MTHLRTLPARLSALALLLLGPVAGLAAQDEPATAPAPTTGDTVPTRVLPPCVAPGDDAIRVTDAFRVVERDSAGRGLRAQRVREVKLGDVLTVQVEQLGRLRARAACLEQPIVLFLNDRPIPRATAYPPSNPDAGLVHFTLRRTEDSREVWTSLLGNPTWNPRPVRVSVGLEGEHAVASTARVGLAVIPRRALLAWALLFFGITGAFLVLAQRSDLLRDTLPAPPGTHRPYSLARAQAAWWFFLILASYLFIGIVTRDFSTTITGTVLVLLGISAGTAIGSAIVDATKTNEVDQTRVAAIVTAAQERLHEADGRLETARRALAKNPGDAAARAALEAADRDKRAVLKELQDQGTISRNLAMDIVTDASGVNFHRFQMVAWTVVLGVVFVGEVYNVLAMPQFNETLLALLGISSGTYLGLKGTENSKPPQPGTATAQVATEAGGTGTGTATPPPAPPPPPPPPPPAAAGEPPVPPAAG